MVCVVVSLLLKRNIGVLFGVLRYPRSDAPPPFFFACYVCVSLCCLVVSAMLCFETERHSASRQHNWKQLDNTNIHNHLGFLDRSGHFFIQVAPQLSSRG
jgi:hypothetical protein